MSWINSWYTRFANTRFVPNLNIAPRQEEKACVDWDVPPREELDKVVLELTGEIGNVSPGVLTDDEHQTEMTLGLDVAFETVFVSALFLADLAVPSKAL